MNNQSTLQVLNGFADKVEIDLLSKKLKISMINKNDKVQITGKY